MGVGVVRADGRSAAQPDARPIQPWVDIAALPDSSAQAFGVALGLTILAFGVLRPVQRKAVAHEPFGTQLTGRRAMKASRSFAASAPRWYRELSSPRHS
jgi:hypothetical protein